MDENKINPQTIDEYIALYPPDVQLILQKIRQTIHEAAPGAAEKISYQMPTFTLHGNLVYFGAFKHHIGFYPTPSGTEAFQNEISEYKAAKGSIQFPFSKPIPYDLIRKIVEFRAMENIEKETTNKSKKY